MLICNPYVQVYLILNIFKLKICIIQQQEEYSEHTYLLNI